MKQVLSVIVVSMLLCAPIFAEETQKGPDDQTASSSTQASHPVPPGLEKHGKKPHGLEKKGKTPPGWSQGKASWKHPGEASSAQHGSPPMGNKGVVTSGHPPHPSTGHGHR